MSKLAQMLQAPGMSIEADGDFDAVNAMVMEKGWGDGLPVVPPTEERVAAMLEYCDRPWDQPIAKIPPRWGEANAAAPGGERGDGGLRAALFSALHAGHRSDVRGTAESIWRSGDDASLRAAGHRQRSGG